MTTPLAEAFLHGVARVALPAKLVPVFEGEADVRGAYGGRGSAKTRSFALMSAIRVVMMDLAGRRGIVLCCRQFMNSLDDSSMQEIKEAIRSEPWLAAYFEIGEKFIRTRSGRIAYKFAGLDRHLDSIKSKARILICWVDEAEPVTEAAWEKLIPTIREEDSELWVTWNPERRGSPTDLRFRKAKGPRMRVVECNWRDNPFFPGSLDRKRIEDRRERPDSYEHVWEGGYKTAQKGAYYAMQMLRAKQERRIGFVTRDPLLKVHLFWDLASSSDKADNVAIWAMQMVGPQIRVLAYYEAQGQDFPAHVAWARSGGFEPGSTVMVLPHDGVRHDVIFAATPQGYLQKAGYAVEVIPNQGKGAALARIDAARLVFHQVWFNEGTTEVGRDCLSMYHRKIDEKRSVDLGPDHDAYSHGADAFGLMGVWRQMHPSTSTATRSGSPKRRASVMTA